MAVLFLVLLLLGAVCFAVTAVGYAHPKVNLLGLGLLFWILVPLIQAIVGLAAHH